MYGERKAIREDLLERIWPILEQYRNGLIIREYDIALRTWAVQTPTGTHELNSYALIVVINGALVGKEHFISFVWTFGADPQSPDDAELHVVVPELFRRLRTMQQQQLLRNNPDTNPN